MKKILFQGDSITDASRLFLPEYQGLGEGYVKKISEQLEEKLKQVEVINRGIAGECTSDLLRRWEEDCIEIDPDILTIMIGINDVWTMMEGDSVQTIREFEINYESLIKQAVTKTSAKIIVMEPFVFPWPASRILWRPLLDERIQVIRRLAYRYQLTLIPLDGILNSKAINIGYDAITTDGVHLTSQGHALVADIWMETFFKLKI